MKTPALLRRARAGRIGVRTGFRSGRIPSATGWPILLVLFAGLALGPGVPVRAGAPPPELVTLLEDGLACDSYVVRRVQPVLDPNAPTVLRSFRTNAAAIAANLRWVTNEIRLRQRDRESGLGEETLVEFDSAGPATILRFGWAPKFLWKQAGAELPWLVPFEEPGVDRDAFARSIRELVAAHRRTLEGLQSNLGLPHLLGARLRYDPEAGLFRARGSGREGEIPVRADWDGRQLILRYVAGPHSLAYLAVLSFTGGEGNRTVDRVDVYNSPEPDPRYRIDSFTFVSVDHDRLPVGSALNPMETLGWKEWLEFAEGEWLQRRPDGRVTWLPGFTRPTSFMAEHRWLLVGGVLFAGLLTLVLARVAHLRTRDRMERKTP